MNNGTSYNILNADVDAKVVVRKIASIARTDTSTKNLFTIPINAIPLRIAVYIPTASDAGSTATISVGKTGTNTYFVNGFDVKGNSGQQSPSAVSHLMSAVSTSAATQITGVYAETGGASSTGGPFYVLFEYYLA